jgi:hypothetical protein
MLIDFLNGRVNTVQVFNASTNNGGEDNQLKGVPRVLAALLLPLILGAPRDY